jgi:hypothetical protein
MKLFLISLATVLFSGLIWATLWFWGQGFSYQPYEHPLMTWKSEGQPLQALSTFHPEEAREFLSKNPEGVLFLNLYVSADGEFFTAPEKALQFPQEVLKKLPDAYKGNKHHYYKMETIKSQLQDQAFPLEAFLNLKPRFWMFNINDNALEIDRNMIAWIEKYGMESQVVVLSDIDLVVSSMKDQRPLWIYGSTQSDLAKLLTLASVNLEGIANVRRDFFVTPIFLKERLVLNSSVIREMKRRFKKVAIGPVHTDQDRVLALKEQPDLLIISSHLTQGSK